MPEENGLSKIYGSGRILANENDLAEYSRDMSFVSTLKPRCVVKPGNLQEVQDTVNWANQTRTPLVPVSSGPPHFNGDTVPTAPGAVMVDLSGMKKIVAINRRNRLAVIEAGVTYGQIHSELAREGLCLTTTLAPRANKSVISSLLEREPRLVPKYQWSALDPLRCLEITWGDGQKMTTGNAESAGTLEEEWKMGMAPFMAAGPAQTDFYRFVSGAQGSMGIVTWASIKCEVLPQLHKLFLVSAAKPDNLLDFVYRLLRFRFGDELLLLNGSTLAYILGENADRVKALRQALPPWIVLVGIAGRDRLPQQRIDFQAEDISDIAQQFGLKLDPEIPGARNSEIAQALFNPSREPYWKLNYKGGCQDIFFVTTLEKTPQFVNTMYSVAEMQGYPTSDIGIYLQPIHQGASCHCEFSLPYDPGNSRETARVKELFTAASRELLNQGAFFSRPYGIWADMALNRDAQTANVLKKIKGIFDPNNIMNPGKLCF
jgi:FAD/FMN-containing dehydrogenase